jgi:hypothetical protein
VPTGRGGDLYKLLGIGGRERGQGPDCGTHVFALLGNLSIVQINHSHFFITQPTDALIAKICFVKNLYMFRVVAVPIIRSFPLYIRHWYVSCRFDDSFQAGPF